MCMYMEANINLQAMFEQDVDNCGYRRPLANSVNHLETPLRVLQTPHRASCCGNRMVLCGCVGMHVCMCLHMRVVTL